MGSSQQKRSHRVREIQNPVPSSWRGQQELGLVWHPLGAKGLVRSRKPCKGKGRKAGLSRSGEVSRMKDFLRDRAVGRDLWRRMQVGRGGQVGNPYPYLERGN